MKKNIHHIINRYLNHTNSLEELKKLKKWVAKERNASIFKEYIYNYYRYDSFNAKKAFILFENNITNHGSKVLKRKTERIPFLKYAAIFIGILASTYTLYKYTSSTVNTSIIEVTLEMEDGSFRTLNEAETQDIVSENGTLLGSQNQNELIYNNDAESSNELVYNVLRVPYGKRFQLQLSDGSRVHLNAGSKLKYPVKFIKGRSRRVFLEGEGYFKITKNQGAPFIVSANTINTEVFGTAFNISSYIEDSHSKVVLVEGSIGVFSDGDSFNPTSGILLRPNEMATKTNQETIVISAVNVKNHTSWINGTLLFKNEDFNTIIRKLERHYDVKITNNYKALEYKKFTGRFDIENVGQILNTFRKTNPFTFTVQGDEISINP